MTRRTERVAGSRVDRLDVRQLAPARGRAFENIRGATVDLRLALLVAVDPDRAAILIEGADNQTVAATRQRNALTEEVLRLGVRRLDVCLLISGDGRIMLAESRLEMILEDDLLREHLGRLSVRTPSRRATPTPLAPLDQGSTSDVVLSRATYSRGAVSSAATLKPGVSSGQAWNTCGPPPFQ